MALFGIATIVHFALMFPFRATYFIPLVLGGVCTSISFPSLNLSSTNNLPQAKHSDTTVGHGRTKAGQKSPHGLSKKCSSYVLLLSSPQQFIWSLVESFALLALNI